MIATRIGIWCLGALSILSVFAATEPAHSAQPFVVAGNNGALDRVCTGDGESLPFCGSITPSDAGSNTAAVAIGDLDGDGDMDLMIAKSGDHRPEACLNDGQHIFTCQPVGHVLSTRWRDVALGDFDGNGTLDAAFSRESIDAENAQVCINYGPATFLCYVMHDGAAGGFYYKAVDTGDLNNDGILDLVFAAVGQPSQYCFGDGDAFFTVCGDITATELPASSVALGDLNGDGNLDVVISEGDFPVPDCPCHSSACLGNGAGQFSCSPFDGDSSEYDLMAATGDVNGDHLLDLVIAQWGGTNPPDVFCPGDGTGAPPVCFSLPSNDLEHTFDVALADVDSDGRDEIFLAHGQEYGPNRRCDFTGNGGANGTTPQFACSEIDPTSVAPSPAVAAWTPVLFIDDFESGDTSAWSAATP